MTNGDRNAWGLSVSATLVCACVLVLASGCEAARQAPDHERRIELEIGHIPVPPQCVLGIDRVSFHAPTDLIRFYHAKLELKPARLPRRIAHISVDGQEQLYVPYMEGRPWHQWREREYSRRRVPQDTDVVLHVKCAWQPGHTYYFELPYTMPMAEAVGVGTMRITAQAPPTGGYPYPEWRHHRLLVLTEEHGLQRTDEPVTFFLSASSREVDSFAQELRLARLDPATGQVTEVPSQVLSEKVRPSPQREGLEFRTCEVAFLAGAPADGKAYYLVVYGNPEARRPTYESDLRLTWDELGLAWVENDYFRMLLHPRSGQINGVVPKLFGKGQRRKLGVSGLTLHYNPDVWVRGRSWTHTNAWDPPPHSETTVGPVAIVTRRWGPMPRVPEVEVNVTYTFFSKTPYVLVDSTMDVVEEVLANALRSDEVVVRQPRPEGARGHRAKPQPPEQVDHIGWKERGGLVRYKAAEFEPGKAYGMMGLTAFDAPYVCLVNEKQGWGLAGIQLKDFYGARRGESPVLSASHTSLADYGWGFRYWSRVLVYPWGDYQPDRPTVLNAGTFYATRTAYCPFPLGEGESPEERLAYVERLDRLLRSPLRTDHQGAGPW